MVERQDIDALLISALYGELTPSEETRLAAHLDSHPGDRTALADLTHARGLVRESRLFQIQLDPPQSVSTLLMNEARRCAPKPEVKEGWFARFVRSFAAHPAMAAAAMLVVMLGVATFVTRKKADFADSTAPAGPEVTLQEKASGGDSPAMAPSNGVVMGGMAAGSSSAVADQGSAAVVDGLADGSRDQYRVALAEGGDQLADKKQAEASDDQEKQLAPKAKPATKSGSDFGSVVSKESLAKKPNQGIELRSAVEPAPKDFEDEATRRKGSKNMVAYSDNDNLDSNVDARVKSESAPGAAPPTTGSTSSGSRVGNVSGGAGGTGRGYEPNAPTDAVTVAPTTPRPTTTTSKVPSAPRIATPAPPPAPPKADPRPAKTVDRAAPARNAGPADEKPADPQLAWARDQHAALIAQVRAGDCKKAASIATTISNRAPAYYQQNVETDRAVKACVVYINNERERDAEQRNERARANQKRSVNEPAKAAPPSKPAAADTTK